MISVEEAAISSEVEFQSERAVIGVAADISLTLPSITTEALPHKSTQKRQQFWPLYGNASTNLLRMVVFFFTFVHI